MMACIVDVSGCQNSPCLNGGTCQSVGNTYTCVCAGGFTGRHCTEGMVVLQCLTHSAIMTRISQISMTVKVTV
jgi:hypothetical protein